MLHGKNLIGYLSFESGNSTFKTVNPHTNTENPTVFTEATLEEINLATQLAKSAFSEYQNFSNPSKHAFLNQISKNILNLGEDLIEMYCLESGLGFKRALAERARTLWQIKLFSNHLLNGDWVDASIDRAIPDRKPNAKPDLRKMLIPLGPVVVFGSSNFPLAYSTAGGDTISALAAGCPVIVKSHPMHSGTGELIAQAIKEAAQTTGMPEGIFSNINSSNYEAGTHLVSHPDIKAAGFTGSITGGRAIFDLANQREEPIPVFAEMGSINPVILFPDALKERNQELAKIFANSITLDTGQFCTNPGLMIGIDSVELDDFIGNLSKEIVAKKPSCMLHPRILDNYNVNKKLLCDQEGVDLVGWHEANTPSNFGQQAIATAKGKTFLANKTLHLEVFGPFSLLICCTDFEEMEAVINSLEGQLTATIIAQPNELDYSKNIVSAIQNRVGRLIFNGVPTGVEVCKSMHHGGPYPATSNSHFTAVGHDAITRWTRPISFQNWPDNLLPKELQNENPLDILRNIDGEWTKKKMHKNQQEPES